jgi:hypothetical protein
MLHRCYNQRWHKCPGWKAGLYIASSNFLENMQRRAMARLCIFSKINCMFKPVYVIP